MNPNFTEEFNSPEVQRKIKLLNAHGIFVEKTNVKQQPTLLMYGNIWLIMAVTMGDELFLEYRKLNFPKTVLCGYHDRAFMLPSKAPSFDEVADSIAEKTGFPKDNKTFDDKVNFIDPDNGNIMIRLRPYLDEVRAEPIRLDDLDTIYNWLVDSTGISQGDEEEGIIATGSLLESEQKKPKFIKPERPHAPTQEEFQKISGVLSLAGIRLRKRDQSPRYVVSGLPFLMFGPDQAAWKELMKSRIVKAGLNPIPFYGYEYANASYGFAFLDESEVTKFLEATSQLSVDTNGKLKSFQTDHGTLLNYMGKSQTEAWIALTVSSLLELYKRALAKVGEVEDDEAYGKHFSDTLLESDDSAWFDSVAGDFLMKGFKVRKTQRLPGFEIQTSQGIDVTVSSANKVNNKNQVIENALGKLNIPKVLAYRSSRYTTRGYVLFNMEDAMAVAEELVRDQPTFTLIDSSEEKIPYFRILDGDHFIWCNVYISYENWHAVSKKQLMEAHAYIMNGESSDPDEASGIFYTDSMLEGERLGDLAKLIIKDEDFNRISKGLKAFGFNVEKRGHNSFDAWDFPSFQRSLGSEKWFDDIASKVLPITILDQRKYLIPGKDEISKVIEKLESLGFVVNESRSISRSYQVTEPGSSNVLCRIDNSSYNLGNFELNKLELMVLYNYLVEKHGIVADDEMDGIIASDSLFESQVDTYEDLLGVATFNKGLVKLYVPYIIFSDNVEPEEEESFEETLSKCGDYFQGDDQNMIIFMSSHSAREFVRLISYNKRLTVEKPAPDLYFIYRKNGAINTFLGMVSTTFGAVEGSVWAEISLSKFKEIAGHLGKEDNEDDIIDGTSALGTVLEKEENIENIFKVFGLSAPVKIENHKHLEVRAPQITSRFTTDRLEIIRILKELNIPNIQATTLTQEVFILPTKDSIKKVIEYFERDPKFKVIQNTIESSFYQIYDFDVSKSYPRFSIWTSPVPLNISEKEARNLERYLKKISKHMSGDEIGGIINTQSLFEEDMPTFSDWLNNK